MKSLEHKQGNLIGLNSQPIKLFTISKLKQILKKINFTFKASANSYDLIKVITIEVFGIVRVNE